ncbi:hypothetical protein SDJN03_23246, partial [Cucurbita argyrosperma subsp. sororia]
ATSEARKRIASLGEFPDPENFIPGLAVLVSLLGSRWICQKPSKANAKKGYFLPSKYQQISPASNNGDQELKLVLVVRQKDLKMGSGKNWHLNGAHAGYWHVWQLSLMARNKLKDAAENVWPPYFLLLLMLDARRYNLRSVSEWWGNPGHNIA